VGQRQILGQQGRVRALVRVLFAATPAVYRLQKCAPVGRVELVWVVAPCLAERVGVEAVSDDAPPQWALQDVRTPGAIEIPVVGYVVVVADHVGGYVGQRPADMGQRLAKIRQFALVQPKARRAPCLLALIRWTRLRIRAPDVLLCR